MTRTGSVSCLALCLSVVHLACTSEPATPPVPTGGSGGTQASTGGAGGTGGTGGQPPGLGGAAGDTGEDRSANSAQALEQLRAHLDLDRDSRPDLTEQPFARVPLTKDDAATARTLLWEDFAEEVRQTRADEMGATTSTSRTITVGARTMAYYQMVRGDEPPGGRSLFISMHGGGGVQPSVNDEQWDNQIALGNSYAPVDAIWVAPRAPENVWNMWFLDYIDGLFDHLITNMIVFEGVNPNKVYVTGYSAGGDGAYRIGPRMADRWAGVGMSAGHPGEASPVNLYNVAFALHVGGDDTAYDRHTKAAEWGQALDTLAAANPGAYPRQWQVHAGLGHWMNMADAVSIPFLQGYTRTPLPTTVVWRQADVTQARFYWLAVDDENESPNTELRASYAENTVSLVEATDLDAVIVRLNDAMMDLDLPIRVEYDGTLLFEDFVDRTIGVLHRTLHERGDPELVFSSEIAVQLH